MINIILSIISILITLMVVVGLHELGHFSMARLLKVKVLQFSIGFGKTLLKHKDKYGTEYIFALIPLGGYVKMLNTAEDQVSPAELPYAYDQQSFWKKSLIILAGPLTNFICAFLLYYIIFLIGIPTIKPVIGSIQPNSIAAKAQLKPNQLIKTIDGHPIRSWNSALFRIIAHAGSNDSLLLTTSTLDNKQIETYQLDLKHWIMDDLHPDPLSSIGIIPFVPQNPLIITNIEPDSPANNILKAGDTILAINNQPINNFTDLNNIIQKNAYKSLPFTIKRNGKTLTLSVPIQAKQRWSFFPTGYLGISIDISWPASHQKTIQYNLLTAIPQAFYEIVNLSYFNFLILGKIITGKLSIQSLGGPILIFQTANHAFQYGFIAFLSFLAFISVAVGAINILPIPGLDGGHFFISLIETIISRPIPNIVLINAYRLGFSLLFIVLAIALVNDILRL